MKYLLDTHAIIWLTEDSPKISAEIKKIVNTSENSIYIHSISLWEMAIKINLNKLKLNLEFHELLYNLRNNDFDILQIEDEYLKKLSTLPFLHKDPFDRMLIASAIAENLTIITADENIRKYNIKWIW